MPTLNEIRQAEARAIAGTAGMWGEDVLAAARGLQGRAVGGLSELLSAYGGMQEFMVRGFGIGAAPSYATDFTTETLQPVFGSVAPTVTRAGNTATRVNAAGQVEVVNANLPRFDYDPATGKCLGLLLEEARTNSLRNNTMQGAVAGVPGTRPNNWSLVNAQGLSQEVIGVGVESGITYLDIRFYGTANATADLTLSFDASNVTAAVPAQVWTLSAWIAVVAGNAPPMRLRIDEYSAANAWLAFGGTILNGVSSALTRFSTIRTVTNGAAAFVAPYIGVMVTNAVVYDFIIRIGLPQLELGAFATSVIPTTNAAVTRNADVVTLATADIPSFSALEGTMLVDAIRTAPIGGNPNWATNAIFDDGTLVNYIANAWGNSAVAGFETAAAGTYPWDVLGTRRRIAGGWIAGVDGLMAYCNGANSEPAATTAIPAVTTLRFGHYPNNTGWLNGHVSSFVYWPTRFPNATLQQLSVRQ
jgi:hypothetical protein